MSADTITANLLDDLTAVLETSTQAIRRARLMAENGDISPAEAAEIVKDTAAHISQFCRHAVP